MMRKLLLLYLAAFSVSARAAIDLSPFPSEFEGEGVKYTKLSFKDDKRQVDYVPPQNWTWRGGSSQLHLTPPATFARADATIETSPLAEPRPFDEKAVTVLRQQFISTLPPGAQGVKMLSEEQSPVTLGGDIATYEFTATYEILGQTFLRSTLFANLPESQLRFKVTGLKKDFDALHRLFRASLISWQWVEKPAVDVAARP
jgi:hypothetical protein